MEPRERYGPHGDGPISDLCTELVNFVPTDFESREALMMTYDVINLKLPISETFVGECSGNLARLWKFVAAQLINEFHLNFGQ